MVDDKLLKNLKKSDVYNTNYLQIVQTSPNIILIMSEFWFSLLGRVSDDFGRRTKVLRRKKPSFVKGRHVSFTASKRYPPRNHWNHNSFASNTKKVEQSQMTVQKVKESLSESDFMSQWWNTNHFNRNESEPITVWLMQSLHDYMNTMQCIPLQCTSHIEHIYIHWTWHFPPSKLLSIALNGQYHSCISPIFQ